ncbi:hypothetical protein VSR01_17565 [Actinacidiphila sp. DG2A-62]|uniref:hypothetical protein n=1 Tax=Actinacidiphila sp. DG2A-62 TaxID=3108821 RepID=UPI002DBDCD85|nr:hypothetical protein [Actinacidiphila sp. DG2A-62]MEC3995248.1 hypothetical protein [Actinacidiphila sp. DG2A-62]
MPDTRLIGDVAEPRVRLSDDPRWFRTCMARALAVVDQGEDLATAVWTAVDPVQTAAEIEALAGLRRLCSTRKDTK